MSAPVEKVCRHCGSTDVWADAIAKWDGHKWVLDDVTDYEHCDECSGPTTAIERASYDTLKAGAS